MHGVAVSRWLRVVERFTRVAEDALDWQVRVEDPEVYTEIGSLGPAWPKRSTWISFGKEPSY